MGSEPTPAGPLGRPGRNWLFTWSWGAAYLLPFVLSVVVLTAGYALDAMPGFILGLAVVALFWAHEAWCVLRVRSRH